MLELIRLSRVVKRPRQEALKVLDEISFALPKGHLMAVVGATGSGKSTLLDILAGIQQPSAGGVRFQGRDTVRYPIHANHIGHVPAADDVLNDVLTVRESVMSALLLRVAGLSKDEQVDRASHLLVGVGLETVATHPVGTLPLPQRRRLKLALALVSDPALVVCDEFTDGLDVKSEREMAALLKFIASDHPARVVIHATQTLGNLSAYDTVVILHEGHVCFHGPARAVTHYFSITSIDELYPRLAKRPAERWGDSWSRHRDSYYEAFKLGSEGSSLSAPTDEEETPTSLKGSAAAAEISSDPETQTEPAHLPSAAQPALSAQVKHLIQRRWTTLRRSRREWITQLSLLLAAPLLAMLLILPNLHFIQDALKTASPAPEILWPAAYSFSMAWFIQVFLIILLAARNGAREIAGERGLLERELTGGLSAKAYVLGKLGFLVPLVLAQSFTLGLFIEIVTGGLPGYMMPRLILLSLTGLAFTALSLGLSARSRDVDRAQSRAWMLAVVNVLLAGALLGFPRILGGVLQPLVTAYYGWSGGVETVQDTVLFAPITQFVRTWFATPSLAIFALLAHAAVGVVVTLTSLRVRR